jgi:hypothetical protein
MAAELPGEIFSILLLHCFVKTEFDGYAPGIGIHLTGNTKEHLAP